MRKMESGRIAGILPEESGQDLAEYAMLIGGIALLVIAAITTYGQTLLNFWQQIAVDLPL